MVVNEITTTATELQTRSEGDFINEYVTTMNPPDIRMFDVFTERNTDGIDGMFAFYVLGGILIVTIFYLFINSHFLHGEERAEQNELDLGELRNRVASHPSSMNQGRILTENYYKMGKAGQTFTTANGHSSCTQRNSNCNNVEMGMEKEELFITDFPEIPYRSPQEIRESVKRRESSSEVLWQNIVRQAHNMSGIFSRNTENPQTSRSVENSMPDPPLNLSLPQDSKEKIVSLEDLLCQNTAQVQKKESSNEFKSDVDNATPKKGEEKRPPPSAERKCHSFVDIQKRILQEVLRKGEIPKIMCSIPRDLLKISSLPTDDPFLNTQNKVAEMSDAVTDAAENPETSGSVESSQNSNEETFSSDDFLLPITPEIQMDESSNDCNSDADESTLTKSDDKPSPSTP